MAQALKKIESLKGVDKLSERRDVTLSYGNMQFVTKITCHQEHVDRAFAAWLHYRAWCAELVPSVGGEEAFLEKMDYEGATIDEQLYHGTVNARKYFAEQSQRQTNKKLALEETLAAHCLQI